MDLITIIILIGAFALLGILYMVFFGTKKKELVKKCNYCAETVKAEALICKHCGKDINNSTSFVFESKNHKELTKKGITIGDGVRVGCGMFIILPIIIIIVILFFARLMN